MKKKFILERLAKKGIVPDSIMEGDGDENFYRLFVTDTNGVNHVFTLIKNIEVSVREWYEGVYFDDSMDEKTRAIIEKTDPIENAVKEHFKQVFEIEGEDWLLRWS
jgi:hypothetical protein